MAVDYAVATKFSAVDRVTGVFKNMGDAARVFGDKSERSFKKANSGASRFADITKGILTAGIISRATAAIEQGLGGAITEFVRFDDVMTAAATRFKDVGPNAENFSDQLKIIKGAAREAGATTVYTASQAGEALDFLARAGFTSTQAMGSLNSMINLSVATGEDFARVADMSSDLLGAFGMAANDPIKKIANLNRLNDVLVKTANSANVTVENMFETMKTVGPVATGILSASLEEVSALTAVLGNSGIKGSDAMTALKNSYLRLAAPTSDASKLLKQFKISIDDGQGGARKMTDVLSDLGKKMQGMSKVKQAKILDLLFGKFAIAGGKNLIDNIANIKELENALNNAAGTAKDTAGVMGGSLGNMLKTLNSALMELAFKVFSKFETRGKNAIDTLTEAVRNFDPQPIIDGIEFAITATKTFIGLVEELSDYIKIAVGSFVAYNLILKAITITQKAMAMWGFIAAFVSLAAEVRSVSAAMALLNMVMTANPIGLVITAIGLLIAAGVLLYKNWDTVSVVLLKVWEGIKTGVVGYISFMIDFFSFFVKTAISAGSMLAGAFGFDTSSFDAALSKIDALQNKMKSSINAPEYEDRVTGSPLKTAQVAPNEAEINARMQALSFQGTLNITGAPKGSTFENTGKGAPPLMVNLMGAQ